MRIALVLPDEKSAFVMLQESLGALGHQVQFFFYRSVASPVRAPLARLRTRMNPQDDIARMNSLLIEMIKEESPDLVFVNKGEIIFPETIQTIRQVTKVVAWYVDSPLWFNSSSHYIAYSLQHYDIAFVFDGYYIPEMQRWGCRRAEVLSFGCEPTIHRTIHLTAEEKAQYSCDLCFVGNFHGVGSTRESILSRLADYDIKIWGDGWQHSSDKLLRPRWMGRSLGSKEIAKAYSGAKLTLNVTYPHSITQPNMRTFEAPACGALLLNDSLPGIGGFFDVGKEIETYSSVEELIEKIDYYLAHPQEAAQIAKAGQRRAHSEHTYEKRMCKMLSAVFG